MLHLSSPSRLTASPAVLRRYTGIYVGEPCIEEDMVMSRVTPQQCRLRDITYSAPVTVGD
jgi:DNA-directed RNA polymerase III subunit RPC2